MASPVSLPSKFDATIDRARLATSGQEDASTTSHASSSKATHAFGSTRSAYQPLSLADALSRSGGDPTRALDEVLAERNRFCLEAGKLQTENMRIWNLIRRTKDSSKDPSLSQRGSPDSYTTPAIAAVSSTSSRSSPLAMVSNNSKKKENDVTLTGDTNLISTSNLRENYTPDNYQEAAPTAAVQLREGIIAEEKMGDQQFISQMRRRQTSLPTEASSSTSSGSTAQQNSIMQQRAAAQRAAMAQSEGHGRRSSTESQDYEAVDGSSIAPSDDGGEIADVPSSLSMKHHAQSAAEEAVLGTSFHDSRDASDASATTIKPIANEALPFSPLSASFKTTPMQQEHLSGGSVQPHRRQEQAGLPSVQSPVASSSSRGMKNRSTDSLGTPSPRLDASRLSHVQLSVVGSNLRSNERGREVISFFIAVDLRSIGTLGHRVSANSNAPQSWKVEKLYSDVLALDARLKQKHGKHSARRIANAHLPDRTLFKDHAPSKVDQRKTILEMYLQNLLAISLPDKDDLCTFLCTDVVPTKPRDPQATTKEGFLTKKGQNLGRWVTRYYNLAAPKLDYYESRFGALVGSINIAGAQIGRQQRSPTADMDENSYRHAFLILERRPPAAPGEQPQMVRHVLCAESDDERDDWVDVLVRAIGEMDRQTKHSLPPSPKRVLPAEVQDVPLSPTGLRIGDSLLERGNTHKHSDSLNQDTQARAPSEKVEPTPSAGGSGSVAATSHSSKPVAVLGTSSSSIGGARAVSGGVAMDRSNSDSAPLPSEDSVLAKKSCASPPTTQPLTITSRRIRGPSQEEQSQNQTSSITAMDPVRPLTPENKATKPNPNAGGSGSKGAIRPSISGPMNGTPIPTGYKFGTKEEAEKAQTHDAKRRFWHRFGGGGASSDKNVSSSSPRKVFGVPLADSIAVSNVSEGLELPSVVYRCIEYLEKRNAAGEEGLYRLSGSSAVIKQLKDRFDEKGDVDLLASSEDYYDPHAVAGLLKTFLRELPTSVLTADLHLDFLRANDIVDRRERVNELGHLVSMLPLANYSLLRTLCNHLIKIIERQDENKMSMRNVGIVFSPTLGIPAGVFALFLTEFDWVFYTDAKGEPAPRLMEEDIIPPDSAELGKGSFSSNRSYEGTRTGSSTEGSEHFTDSASQDVHGKEYHANRSKARQNRSSWIAGNALHSGDGQVHSLHRNNRNSLSYNDEEAEKLLGGPQGRHRLSGQQGELDQLDLAELREEEDGYSYDGEGGEDDKGGYTASNIQHAGNGATTLQPPVGYGYLPSSTSTSMGSPRYASSLPPSQSQRSRETSAQGLQLPEQSGRSSLAHSVPTSPAGSTRAHRSAPRPPLQLQSPSHQPTPSSPSGGPRSPPPTT